MKWSVLTLLLGNIVRAYHSSCIIKMKAIGEAEGDYINDFDLLDRYGTKDMRLAQT